MHKIGMTRLHPHSRLAALQTAHHNELALAGFVCIPLGTQREAERAAHKSLAAHRSKGEWFRVSLQEAIAAIENATSAPFQFPITQNFLDLSLGISPAQCRAARGLLGWSSKTLAERSQTAVMTVTRFEADQGSTNTSTRAVLKLTLETAGVIFIGPNGDGPGVRMRRERA